MKRSRCCKEAAAAAAPAAAAVSGGKRGLRCLKEYASLYVYVHINIHIYEPRGFKVRCRGSWGLGCRSQDFRA